MTTVDPISSTTGATEPSSGNKEKRVDINANCTAMLYSIDKALQSTDQLILDLAQLTEQAANEKSTLMSAFEAIENATSSDTSDSGDQDPALGKNTDQINKLDQEYFGGDLVHNSLFMIQHGTDSDASQKYSGLFTDENTRVQSMATSFDGEQNIWQSSDNLVTQNRTLGTTLGGDIVQYLASVTRFFS